MFTEIFLSTFASLLENLDAVASPRTIVFLVLVKLAIEVFDRVLVENFDIFTVLKSNFSPCLWLALLRIRRTKGGPFEHLIFEIWTFSAAHGHIAIPLW